MDEIEKTAYWDERLKRIRFEQTGEGAPRGS